MTFDAIDAWWWHFLFILIAGWLATDVWRFLGVHFGGRISEEFDALVLVRAVATALVAAVIGNLFVFPTGALANTTLALRVGGGRRRLRRLSAVGQAHAGRHHRRRDSCSWRRYAGFRRLSSRRANS